MTMVGITPSKLSQELGCPKTGKLRCTFGPVWNLDATLEKAPGRRRSLGVPSYTLGMGTTSIGSTAHAGGSNGGTAGEVIRTAGLTKVYPGTDTAAVDNLDLTVGAGEIFGLLGPNGAGKTTTAGMLTTRVVPTSGQAWIGSVDVIKQPALAKQLIGIVSQQNTLDRQLTVWENLYFHGRLFGIDARRSTRIADALLEQFQLAKWAKASVFALSGGMAQRLMVARAIFHRPAVLFLDEPTAGLDPQSRLALWEILGELNREGQTILLTTHYMEEADKLCGRVAIMDHGRVLALDTPAELKQSVGADTIVTVRAEGDMRMLGERMKAEIEEVTRVRTVDGAVELHLKGAQRLVPRVVDAAERAGYEVADLSVAEPSLETVFINLTGKELRD
jgi:ABC-2 type transport system ATP-binding protein